MPTTSHFRILCFLLTSLILLLGIKVVKPSKMLEIDLLCSRQSPQLPEKHLAFFLRRLRLASMPNLFFHIFQQHI